ncbi:MAG TPA: hypothetical protein VHQ90_05465 [Thermoanaerobaculia bacterium]|nr:hypothetical protein [Thermoanaerobaculia bacterium]
MSTQFSRTLVVFTALAVLSCVVSAPALAAGKTDASQLRVDMRKLWEDHITWTRLWIVSFAAGLPDQEVAAGRLMKNQEDIGNAIKPFYGGAAGTKLTGLLKEHIQGAVELVTAAKAGDAAKIAAAKTGWYRNGDDIAAFLSGANPKNWPLGDMKAGMKEHLDTTLQEAQDRLGGKWAEDARDYDRVKEHILALADTLTKGIVRQFPDRF